MSALAASCAQAGVELAQSGALAEAAAYFWAARRYAPSPDPRDPVAVFQAMLCDRIETALAAQDAETALRLDGLGALFDPSARSRLSADQAARRGADRALDADRALLEGRVERAAAFALASRALNPESQSGRRVHDEAVARLLERATLAPGASPTRDSALSLAMAVAMGATERRLELLGLLESLGDFATVVTLCEEIETDPSTPFEARIDSLRRRAKARAKQAGRTDAEADLAAAEAAREWLVSLGPAEELDTERLRSRANLCYGWRGYRRTLDDLRELKRRQPSDPWIAYNLCVLLRHAQHPDLAGSADLIAAEAADHLANLRVRFHLMRSMGAMPQMMTVARRHALSSPAFSAAPDLYAMALDEEAEPTERFARPRSGLPLVYATLVCWGDAYVDLMERTCIASLLAPGNFPALAEKADLVLELYASAADLPRLRASAPLRRLAGCCEVRIYCFPPSFTRAGTALNYVILGFATHATILRAARRGADLLFLYADVVYASDNFSAVAKRLSKQGRVALFTDALNLYATPMLERVAPHRDGLALILSRDQMLSAASHCLAKRTSYSFYRARDQSTPNEVCRIIFPTDRGLRTHGFVIAPLYVSHAAYAPVVHTDFATQDGRFVEHVLDQVEESEIEVLSGEEFCAAELCDGDGMAFPMVDLGWERAIESYFLGHSLSQRRLSLFRRPILYPGLHPPGETLLADAAVDEQVGRVLALFDASPHLVDVAAEQARMRALLYPR